MNVRPVLPTPEIIDALQPSLTRGNCNWDEIQLAIDTAAACIWQVGMQAWIVTMCNTDDEIEVLVCGGKGAFECAQPFEDAMRALPEHKGKKFRLEGRRAWKRIFKGWNCEDLAGGDVLLTSEV